MEEQERSHDATSSFFGGAVAQAAADYDALHPPPAGHSPVVSWRLCPLGGIVVQLVGWLLGCANEVFQVALFVVAGDWPVAALTAMLAFVSFVITALFLWEDSVTPLGAARSSVVAGLETACWRSFKMPRQVLGAPGTGLVAPYGAMLARNLSPARAASAAIGLLLSAEATAAGHLDRECGGRPHGAQAAQPAMLARLRIWRYLGAVVEFAMVALAAAVLHPVVVASTFLVSAGAIAADTGKPLYIVGAFAVPAALFFGAGASALSLELDDGKYKGWGTARWVLTATLLRHGFLLVLMLIPAAVPPCFEFISSDPMGWPVLHKDFMEPSLAFARVVTDCVLSFVPSDIGAGSCAWPHAAAAGAKLSIGALVLRSLMMAIVALVLPVYLLGTFVMLLCHSRYRRGDVDHDAWKEVVEKDTAITIWGRNRAAFVSNKQCRCDSNGKDYALVASREGESAKTDACRTALPMLVAGNALLTNGEDVGAKCRNLQAAERIGL